MALKPKPHLLLLKLIVLHGVLKHYQSMEIPRTTLSLFPEVPTNILETDRSSKASHSGWHSLTEINVESNNQLPVKLFSKQKFDEENLHPTNFLGLNIGSEKSSPDHPTTSAHPSNIRMSMNKYVDPSYVEVVNFRTPSWGYSEASTIKLITGIIQRFETFSNPEQTNKALSFWTQEKILPFLYFTQFQQPTSKIWHHCMVITSLVFYAYHEKYILSGDYIDYNLLAEFLRWYTETLYYTLHPSFKGLPAEVKDTGGDCGMKHGSHMDPLAVLFLAVHHNSFYQKMFNSLSWGLRYPMAQKIVSKFSEDRFKLKHDGIHMGIRAGQWKDWIERSQKIMESFQKSPRGQEAQKQVIGLGNQQQIYPIAAEFSNLWKNWSPDMTDYVTYKFSITNDNAYQFGHEFTYFLKDQCKALRSQIARSNISDFPTSISLFLQMQALPISHQSRVDFRTGYSEYVSLRNIDAKSYRKRKAMEKA